MKKMLLGLLLMVMLDPNPGSAFYDQDSFWNSPHDQPAWFEMDKEGGFYGETISGATFTQRAVVNKSNLRLQKFVIGTAYFYISDKGVIRAENDLTAVSIYFTLT